MKNYTYYMDNISIDATLHDKIINRVTQKPAPRARNKITIRYAGIAACAAVMLICALAIPGLFNTPTENPHNGNQIGASPDGDYSVYVPAIELPKNTSGSAADMIGLFVYQGRIYTQASWYYNDEAAAIKELIGERLGTAKGNINEWSKQDEYAVEFAGTAAGDVYTVKGYDKRFRLCMMGSYTDDDGNHVEWVNFYENLNGIDLTCGSDLFGDSRLTLRDNWKHVKAQKHGDWDYHKQIFNDLEGVTDNDIDAFIDALYSGKFEYVYETVGVDSFYTEDQKQAHLYLTMEDNSVVELRLFEGGYVGYQHLGWYFVKMPGEAFDLIFNASRKVIAN